MAALAIPYHLDERLEGFTAPPLTSPSVRVFYLV